MMQWSRPTAMHRNSFWLPIPLICFALMYIFYDERVWYDWRVWPVSWGIIFVLAYGSWRMHVQYNFFLHRQFPSLQQTGHRILYKLLAAFLIMSPSVLLIVYLFHALQIMGYRIQPGDLRYAGLTGISVNLIFESLWEVYYIIDKQKEATAEKEALLQMQLNHEFDHLKQKVNPHFLFNCFNTLSSLISENKDRAEVFLDEMSKVYRYLLRNNEDGMSTLENELKFIRSYFQLLKTRHGEAVHLQVEVDRQYYPYLLPSLSLQMLVENVVKHNALSKNKPLSIDIFTTVGNKLVVNNNLQRRTAQIPSGRVGLENIKAKYALLKQAGFQVLEDEKNFTVVLPLIWKGEGTHNH